VNFPARWKLVTQPEESPPRSEEPTSERVDAVLPLTLTDCERAEILLKSLNRFFEDLGTLWIVTPPGELDVIRSRIAGERYRVIPESILVPELKFYYLLRRLGFYHLREFYHSAQKLRFDQVIRVSLGHCRALLTGWFVQQVVKMAIAEKVKTPFYMAFDADVICTRKVRYSDLVRNGRAITRVIATDIRPQWPEWYYARAEHLLGFNRSGLTHGVTPSILSREAMLQLHDYLSARVSPLLRTVAKLLPDQSPLRAIMCSWRSYLLRNFPWTEYTLYHTFLEAAGLWKKYHFNGGERAVFRNSVWRKEDFRSWNPELSFHNAECFFSVVQSRIGVSAGEVWEKVRPYLGDGDARFRASGR